MYAEDERNFGDADLTISAIAQNTLVAENVRLRHRLEKAEALIREMREMQATQALPASAAGHDPEAAAQPTPIAATPSAATPSAATLTGFIAAAPLGMLLFDADMRYVHINEQLAEMNGLSAEAHIGKTYKEIVPDLYEQTAAIFYKVLHQGVAISDCVVEGETPKSPGAKRTWQVCWFPVRGADGQPSGVGAIVQEITEQRRIEKQLLEAEATEKSANARVVAVMESLTEGLCVLDPEFRVTYINTAGEKIINLSRKNLLGRTQWEVFPESLGTPLEHQFRRAMTERVTIEFENRYAPWDTWYAFKLYPAADGGLGVLYRDITDTRRLADARQLADERLRRVFDTQTVGMIEWNFDRGLITAANRYFLELVGYSADDVAAGKLDFRAMTPPEWTAINEASILEIQRSGRAPAIEKEYIRKDGSRVPILIAGVSFENSANEGMSVIVDLTKVKQAERNLRASEERFRVAVGAVSSCVWTTNADGLVVEEMTSWANFTGQNQLSYQGHGWSNAIHPDDIQTTLGAWQEAVRTKKVYEFEHRVLRNDGKWRLCFVRAVPVLDSHGEIAEWVGVTTDITEQHQAEAKVKASEVRYRRLFESAKDGILILDAHSALITDANPFIAEMLGYSQDQFVGKALWQIGLFKDVEASKVAMRELQEKRYIRYEDLPLQTNDGQRINVEFVSNVYGEEGEAVIQCNIRDISERKRLEESLRQNAAELLAADRRKDGFLATLAHELRNPLAPIRNGLQIMRLAGSDRQAIDQCLSMMERQLGQMVHLVDDLLDVSRISRGKLDLRKQRIELSAVLNNAVETSRPLIQAKAHELTIVVPHESVFLDADLTRLGQVFSNLLNNAAKYSEPGGRIHLTAVTQGSDVVVSVRDSGVGISPDMLTKIFDMFTQVNRSLDKAQGGLGIGLCLVKQLVELHGGSVEARSDGHGQGCEFVVRLPLATSPLLPHTPPATPLNTLPDTSADTARGLNDIKPPSAAVVAPGSHMQRRILVADDNVDAVASLAMFLAILGNEVRSAKDGVEAVSVAAEFKPDVILLDIGMPKLNGYDACRRIREQPGGAHAYLIALTGWGQDEDRRRSLDAGFDHHLVKPMDPAALEQLLATLPAARA